MNGIDKIAASIVDEARAKADDLLAEARTQAGAIGRSYAEQASRAAGTLLDEGRAQAAARRERMAGAAQLEGRKLMLQAKQEALSDAFALALKNLREQPREAYTALLTALLLRAVTTGREEVIMSPADRAQVGKEVVTAANDALARAVAPKLPGQITESRLGALLEDAVNTVNAVAHGTAMLTLSAETRPMTGGFILKDGPVEVNCTLETLVDQRRDALAAELARELFPGV